MPNPNQIDSDIFLADPRDNPLTKFLRVTVEKGIAKFLPVGLTFQPYASKDVPVTSAEILALNATAKTLLPAPGAGLAIDFIGAIMYLKYNSIAYNGIAAGEDFAFKTTDKNGTTVATGETTGFMDATADAYMIVKPAVSPILQVNTPLVLCLLTGEIATGNSPMGVRVFYNIVDVSGLAAV